MMHILYLLLFLIIALFHLVTFVVFHSNTAYWGVLSFSMETKGFLVMPLLRGMDGMLMLTLEGFSVCATVDTSAEMKCPNRKYDLPEG